ncbi:hypothetical protein CCP3SC15_1240014 [Gammaproteobacteria bacterium]
MEFLPTSISIGTLTSGAAPVVQAFQMVILVSLGISLGIFGVGLIVAMLANVVGGLRGGVATGRGTQQFGRK